MDKYRENLGKPDLKIAGLQIWVHGRESPDEDWLRVTMHCGTENSDVWVVRESIIYISDLMNLRDILQKILYKQKNEVRFRLTQPYLTINFAGSDSQTVDEVKVKIDITPNQMFEMHGYIFESGKSELSDLISQIEAILKQYPQVEAS